MVTHPPIEIRQPDSLYHPAYCRDCTQDTSNESWLDKHLYSLDQACRSSTNHQKSRHDQMCRKQRVLPWNSKNPIKIRLSSAKLKIKVDVNTYM